MKTEQEITHTSRGWLGFLGLVFTVLLVVFATGLGLTLTVGTPKRLANAATSAENLPRITAAANRQVLQAARAAGVVFAPTTQLVPQAAVKTTVTTGILRAAEFKSTVPLTTLTQAVNKRLASALTAQHVSAPAAVQAAATKRVNAELARVVNEDLMHGGLGTAYPMLVLVLQTVTIVSGVLGGLLLIGMHLAAHGWRRWLRVSGRITYVVGFLGGGAAIAAGWPGLLNNFHIPGIPVAVFVSVMSGFAPSWQRLAGIVVVVGLVLALAGDFLPAVVDKPAELGH